MTEHSILPPSSASRRVACPGSRKLEAQFTDEQSDSAREGELAHFVAARMLADKRYCTLVLENHLKNDSYDIVYTPEMIDGGKLYAEHVLSKIHNKNDVIHIEEKIDISTVHPDCWGTCDAWCFDFDTQELHIWDYKFGHKYVEVFENWQLIEYAAGIMEYLGRPCISVNMYIVQPRSYHRDGPIKTWSITSATLWDNYIPRLRRLEEISLLPQAPCVPSPECLYCSGRHVCTALQQATAQVMDFSKKDTRNDLTPEALAIELKLLESASELIKARLTGLSQEATSRITRGERVPGYCLAQSYGHEKWTKTTNEIIGLGQICGVDLVKPTEVITPNQARSAGVPDELVRSYSARARGGFRLEQDKTAIKLFGGIKNDD